ncbi:MAG: peptidoglycan bridge formation glycyltransferase FemA/FemB family protein, partial [Anaerolineales bacterium]|nr:peptidoglycan bridge formation glycyltransferase FemA/FemB family protein [Anaerolineales bacterium]
YYRDAWGRFIESGLACPLIAEFESEPIAALILFCFGDRAWYMYGSSRDVHRDKMPNHRLQWEAIRWAKSQGHSIYDMWGAPDTFADSDPMWGVWRFKAGFGGRVVRHTGAWDKTLSRPWRRIYNAVIPRYLAVRRSLSAFSRQQ